MGHFYLTTTLRLTTGDRFAGCDTSNNSLFNRKLKQKLRRLFSSAFRDSLCADSGWGTTNSKLFKKQKTESEASAAVFSRFTEINFAQILVVTRQTVDYLTENRNRSLNGCFFGLQALALSRFWLWNFELTKTLKTESSRQLNEDFCRSSNRKVFALSCNLNLLNLF